MFKKYLIYFVFLFLISFCSKQAEVTEDEYIDKEVEDTVEAVVNEDEEKEDDGYTKEVNSNKSDISVAKIRNLFKREKYQQVLDYVQEYSGDLSLYYSGVAYFNLYLQSDEYGSEDRKRFLKSSINDLLESLEKTENADLKEKVLFQLGVVHHLKSSSSDSQEKAIEYFQKIRQEVKDGDYEADSIWAEAYVKVKMFKKREEAKSLLMELDSVRDPYIYNFVDKIYYTSDGKKAKNRIVK